MATADRNRKIGTMDRTTIILLGLGIIVFARIRSSSLAKPTWLQHFKGRQKILGVVAAILTLLILLNPELLALGLLGDAAFVDIMILGLSLQLHMLASRALRISLNVVAKGGRWLGVPSPGLACLLTFSAIAIGCKLAALQKALHRVSTLM